MHLQGTAMAPCMCVSYNDQTDSKKLEQLVNENPWLKSQVLKTRIYYYSSYVQMDILFIRMYFFLQKLVAKVDQLIKRRGKLGLVGIVPDFTAALAWIQERYRKPFKIGATEGTLSSFIVEPFVPHTQVTIK